MKKIISLFVIFFLFSAFHSLQSATILFKSGEKLEGTVINQDKETVTIKLADETSKTYPKKLIRKIFFGKIEEPPPSQKETQAEEREKKEREEKTLTEKQKQEDAKLKSKEEKVKKREQELLESQRHYLEVAFGIGGGENQTELRPFLQTMQYAGLVIGDGGQAEIQTTPYKTPNSSFTSRLFYAWNRFTFELRGTEAKGNLELGGIQSLNIAGEKVGNLILGNGNTKFQKVSSRIGFTPYPHPVLDLQILGGVERIWTKTKEEIYSIGEPAPISGIDPNRFGSRNFSNPLKGYSYGIGFEYKFLQRYTFQGQLLHIEMEGPSSVRSKELRFDTVNNYSQNSLDYYWKSSGTEINLKLTARIKGNWSVFFEASNMTLKNKLQSGYISESGGGGNSDLSQELLKFYGPQILIPMMYDSKTILTYAQIGANYRFDF
ncbi:hypothetical protein AB3N59_02370 [Leptospira sp. WS92.C1]